MKRSRFNFQSAAERGLIKGDQMTQKLINQNEPDLVLPSFILPNQSNGLNLSVQLTRKMNSDTYSPEHQTKVLNESQMTKLLLPQIDNKIPVQQDNSVNLQQSFQFQGLMDENLGFQHNFLHEQSFEQNHEKKQISRQLTYSQNQFYLNHSPRKRQYSFQINKNFKSNLDITNEKDFQDDEIEENISDIEKNIISKEKEIQQIGASQDSNPIQKQRVSLLLEIQSQFYCYQGSVENDYISQTIKAKMDNKLATIFQINQIVQIQGQISPKQNKIMDLNINDQSTICFKILSSQIMEFYSNINVFRLQEGNIEDFQKDQAITNFLNLCSLLISNLEVMTQPNNLLPELGYQSYLEQFVEYRQTYNIFVTKRTSYLQNKYSKIKPIEKAMIATECVIMNNFIPNLVLLTENKKVFNADDQNIQFLIRGFITILQQLFIMTFSDIPQVQTLNTEFKYQQMQIGRNKYGMILVPIQTDMEEFYKGTFKLDKLRSIFERRGWFSNLVKQFKKVVRNIYQQKIQDL
ncbi:unnamed protein product [Paramecium octaurelia]|uniref:Uncharacterized protein n=1 Tax=Paramecium octaurelia TaxID=43137 RepID=A0A8S1TY28_PAROT|nr:unnamed protein product [Paramecium octaurelia]